jgi:trehalose synthase
MSFRGLVELDDYRPLVGDETVDRIHQKAANLRGLRVVHMNSTYYAGGVVEILSSMVTMLNQLGLKVEWRLLRGTPAFFEVTREMHDALQNGDINLTEEKKRIYEDGIYENAMRNHIDHDAVYIHDHHTMGMVAHFRKRGPWIWRCHLDLTRPHPDLIAYLRQFAEQYSAMICILEDYKQDFRIPQVAMMPAIDPFKAANQSMTTSEIDERLARYGIPTDLPIVTQISRYDRWKDPHGVIDAFKLAEREVKATGGVAGVVGIRRWRSLRLMQPAKTGVEAPVETTP